MTSSSTIAPISSCLFSTEGSSSEVSMARCQLQRLNEAAADDDAGACRSYETSMAATVRTKRSFLRSYETSMAATVRTKRSFLSWKVCLFLLFTLLSVISVAAEEGTCSTEDGQDCKNPEAAAAAADATAATDNNSKGAPTDKDGNPIRIVTRKELALHDGEQTAEDGSTTKITEIWLSILGEVYDVSSGKEYYAKGSGYSGMAAKDCSLCFVSGTFTQEEGDKSTEEIPFEQLPAVIDWRGFYADHKTYTFVGYLLDDRFYDEHAKPTPKMLELRERVKEAMAAAEIKKAERAKKREELKKKREEEKKNKLKVETAASAKQ